MDNDLIQAATAAKHDLILTADPLVQQAYAIAARKHKGVPYGNGGTMLTQVYETCAMLVKFGETDPNILATALLSKVREEKRLAEGEGKMPLSDIARLVNPTVAKNVEIISQEPSDEEIQRVFGGKKPSKALEQAYMAGWMRSLPRAVKLIFLAEKYANLVTSRDNPNPTWPPEKHAEYAEGRGPTIQACADANPEMAQAAMDARQEVITRDRAVIKARDGVQNN